MTESSKSLETENSIPTRPNSQSMKVRPSLLPLGVLTLVGLVAVTWLTFVVMENVISRESKEAEIQALSSRLKISRTAVENIESDLEAKKSIHLDLQQAVDRLNTQKEALDRDIKEAHVTIEKARVFRNTQLELDRMVTESRRNLDELENKRANLTNQIASEQQRMTELKAERERVAGHLQLIRKDLEILRTDRDRAEEEKMETQNVLAGLLAQVEEVQLRLSTVSGNLDNGRNELGMLESRLESLRTQASDASEAAGRETAALVASRGQREKLTGEVVLLESRKATLEQEIADLQSNQQAIEHVRPELLNIQAEHTSAQDNLHRILTKIARLVQWNMSLKRERISNGK